MQLNQRVRLALTSSLVAMLAACGGGQGESAITVESQGRPTARALAAASESPLSIPNIAVIGLTKVRETRITRTEFEYVYSVTVSNTGTPAADVTVTLAQVPVGTKIIDGKAVFGAVPKIQSQTSSDTITIRQDRTVQFGPAALKWVVTLAPSLDPIGVDANGNGVRDDIDRAIDNMPTSNPETKIAIQNLARSFQAFANAPGSLSQAEIRALIIVESRAGFCIAERTGMAAARTINDELFLRTFDTSERRERRQRLEQLAGSFLVPAEAQRCQ